jgi:hypothetical protein
MKAKNSYFFLNLKLKKLPYYFLVGFLTIGPSLTIGLLSFGGMFAIWPILAPGLITFALSVAYEGEIYLQNVKNALNKLFFKREFLKHYLANEFLRNHFPSDTNSTDCPQFFRDYKALVKQRDLFGHKALDTESTIRRDGIEKSLRDMEKWFAQELLGNKNKPVATEPLSAYQTELRTWLSANEQIKTIKLLKTRALIFKAVLLFSVISGFCMGFGSIYLMVGAFTVIPIIAAIPFALLPILILPLAMNITIAACLQSYNAITDFINNDTLRKWLYKIRDGFKNGLNLRTVALASVALVLFALALVLTICTAGTWWTVVKNAPPLFGWMGKIPGFIVGFIIPLFSGISTLIFDVENTSETLEMLEKGLDKKGNIFQRAIKHTIESFQELRARENWLQILNPFRILLLVTFVPLRAILFVGHILSIAVTTDQIPGPKVIETILKYLSILFAAGSEFVQDGHYFMGHSHSHDHKHGHEHMKEMLEERLGNKPGHSHDADLPTRILQILFSPLFLLAAVWARCASQRNGKIVVRSKPLSEGEVEKAKPVLTFNDAWLKMTGQKKEKTITVPADAKQPSIQWYEEQAVYRIERHKEKQLASPFIKPRLAEEKVEKLTTLQRTIRNPSKLVTMEEQIKAAAADPFYNRQRFFGKGNTKTTEFLEQLPERINAAAPAA